MKKHLQDLKKQWKTIIKIPTKILYVSLFIFNISCINTLENKVDNLKNCSTSYIKDLIVVTGKYSNIDRFTFVFKIEDSPNKNYYYYLKYDNKYYFLYYSSDEANFSNKELYLDSTITLLKKVSQKTEYNEFGIKKSYFKIDGKNLENEIVKIITNGKIIAQDKNGRVSNIYLFCNKTQIFVDKKNNSFKDGLIIHFPKFKIYNQIKHN